MCRCLCGSAPRNSARSPRENQRSGMGTPPTLDDLIPDKDEADERLYD